MGFKTDDVYMIDNDVGVVINRDSRLIAVNNDYEETSFYWVYTHCTITERLDIARRFGFKRVKKAYRESLYMSAYKNIKITLREYGSSLEKYLELSYAIGMNPLPELRAMGIDVVWGTEGLPWQLKIHYNSDYGVRIKTPTFEPYLKSEYGEKVRSRIEHFGKIETHCKKRRIVHKKII